MKKIWGNYFKPTPKNIAKILLWVKGILGTSAFVALFSDQPTAAALIALAAGAINETVTFLTSENENNKNNSNNNNGNA